MAWRLARAGAAAALIAALAPLGPGEAAAPPADTLVVGMLTDPVTLDPHRATDLVAAAVVANVCDPLVRLRPDGGRPEAALATTWATLDSRVWTFTLREGVRFHDGTPLDADAVAANIDNLRRRRGFQGHAERAGPLVVTVTLDKPNAALLATLSQPFYAMQSPASLGQSRPVGTGPFRLARLEEGRIELAAHPEHWGGPPRLSHVVFRRLRGEDALVQALLAGEVDVMPSVSQGQVARLHASRDVAVESQAGLNLAFLSLNNEHRPFGDRRVRQALARALNRDELVAHILAGHGLPARNPMPPALFGYGNWTRELILDAPLARRLLAEAGFPAGFDTTLLAVDAPRPYMPAPLALASQIKDQLAAVGVRVRVIQVPTWAEYLGRGGRGDYDMMALGWQADTTDPNDFLSALLGSEAIGVTNRSRYSSPEMDALLKRGRMAADPDERLATYREAQELFQRDMPWLPLYHVSVFTASRRTVRGLSLGPTGILRYEKVWKAQ